MGVTIHLMWYHYTQCQYNWHHHSHDYRYLAWEWGCYICIYTNLAPRLSDLFNVHEKRRRAWDLMSCDKSWHDVMKERRQQLSILKWSTNFSYQKQLFEASKDHDTLTWRLWHHIFHPHRTGVLENMIRPHAIFTICHPSYPSMWAYVTHMTLDPRLPLFSHVCCKEWGAWGRG